MPRRVVLVPACAVVVAMELVASGCGGGTTESTCRDFMQLDDAGRDAAVLDWAREHDALVQDRDPTNPVVSFALRNDKHALEEHCSQPDHKGDTLRDVQLDVGFQMANPAPWAARKERQ